MAPRTRSVTSSPVKKATVVSVVPATSKHPSVKMLLLPRNISIEARFLSLHHPADHSKTQFLFCPKIGLLEMKKTSVPPSDPRSILFTPEDHEHIKPQILASANNNSFASGHVSKHAELLTATPYDLAFILLDVLAPETMPTKKAFFQPMEDILDSLNIDDQHLKFIVQNGRSFVEQAMLRICDTAQAGDETMFRYSEDKVFEFILRKAEYVAKAGLPASLEDRFVTRSLESPVLNIKREDTVISTVPLQTPVVDSANPQDMSLDSQATVDSALSSVISSEATTTTTASSIVEDEVPFEIKHLQRVRTAYKFISASYLPRHLSVRLDARIAENTLIHFQPLEKFLTQLEVLRAEVAASRSVTDFGRKRDLDDDEIAEERAEKKRRLEEEERRKKANESRGVRDLKKVNVSGMKKMSDFFSKKPVMAKVKS